jgi:hypothetical protein
MIWAAQNINTSLSKRVSKHCPSSVQAPRNLSKRTFQSKKTPTFTAPPACKTSPSYPYIILEGFYEKMRASWTGFTPRPPLLPQPLLEFYTPRFCDSRTLDQALFPCFAEPRLVRLASLVSLGGLVK